MQIPCVNDVALHELTPNCLVRYRCMIQDSFDPVYFTNIHTVKNKITGQLKKICLKYKETIDLPVKIFQLIFFKNKFQLIKEWL